MPEQPINWATSTPSALRRHAAQSWRSAAIPVPPEVTITALAAHDGFLGGVCCSPDEARANGPIVYFHGGGFVTGSPEERHLTTAWLASITLRTVWSCRYRLAPEVGWHAMAKDAAAALRWALAGLNAGQRLFVSADSAGVSVALWGLATLDALEQRQIAGCVFLYGAYGDPRPASAARLGTVENGLDFAALAAMYARLGPDMPRASAHWLDPRIPSLVLVGEQDPLLDDSLNWHDQRMRGEAPADYCVTADLSHGFLRFAGQSDAVQGQLMRAKDWLDEVDSN